MRTRQWNNVLFLFYFEVAYSFTHHIHVGLYISIIWVSFHIYISDILKNTKEGFFACHNVHIQYSCFDRHVFSAWLGCSQSVCLGDLIYHFVHGSSAIFIIVEITGLPLTPCPLHNGNHANSLLTYYQVL